MRRTILRRAWLGVVLALLGPGGARAQDYSPPAVQWPIPLYNTHPGNGGLFLDMGYAMYHQTNTIKPQPVAYRGFVDVDGSITGQATTFVGTRNVALDTGQLYGPSTWQPGFNVEGGWKFSDGSALTVSFLWLADAQYRADATLANTNYQYRPDQADTFLTAFVFNFPPEFAGAAQKVATGNPGATFGIWNAASSMTMYFIQRFEQLEATYRVPVYENECYRISGLIGPRFVWLLDKFNWRTVDLDVNGNQPANDVGIYSDTVSNRCYGIHAGCQQEWYLGRGFAAMLTLQGAGFIDVTRREAGYGLGLDSFGIKNFRVVKSWYGVGEGQATAGMMWYPIEGVQISLLYDIMAFAGAIASPRPIDFNYSSVNPGIEYPLRIIHGFQANIAIIF